MVAELTMNGRARRQEATRRQIVEATLELHGTLGPARTSISAIARRAGVQRLTVYNHFPDERALFSACTVQAVAQDPPPDPIPWRRITDPEARLRAGLAEVYGYYGRTEGLMANMTRDVPTLPVLAEVIAPFFVRKWELMRDTLARGWGARGERRGLLLAALGHALDFQTWRSLVRQRELDDEQAIELMVGLIRSV